MTDGCVLDLGARIGELGGKIVICDRITRGNWKRTKGPYRKEKTRRLGGGEARCYAIAYERVIRRAIIIDLAQQPGEIELRGEIFATGYQEIENSQELRSMLIAVCKEKQGIYMN